MVIPLLLCCLALFQSTNATNANKKQGATTATNSFTTATPASSSTTTATFPRWHATNTTSFNIDPSIGDAVNIYRKFLEIEHLARTRTDTTAPLPTIFFNDMKQTMTATFNDKLQSLCSGLETISPTKNTTVYQDLVAAAQSLVRSNRHSSLAISLLGIVLSGADSINGEQSTEMTLRAFRRASQVNNVRLKTIQDLLETIQTTEPSSYPFVHEYYMRERRIYGRTFNLMGRLLFDLGEWKDSIVALESAVELDHSIPEAYEWLARAYDRDARPDDFFKAWHQALSVDPWASDRNVWPVFCVTIQHPSVPDTPRLSINRERQRVLSLSRHERMSKHNANDLEEMTEMKTYQPVRDDSSIPNRYDVLMNVINSIRHLECTPTFVGNRNQAMHEYHEQMILEQQQHHPNNEGDRDYTFINFAYGMVFYHGFHRLFTTHPMAMEAISRARGRHLDWVSFGSNVGTETFYAALTWNLNSVGYDVLCALVDHSKIFRKEYHLEEKTNFHCMDALDSDLSNGGVIWIDNQSWDEHLTNKIYTKLTNDAIPGSLIIEYAMSDYHAGTNLVLGNSLDLVGCAKLEVSWDNNAGTTVSMFQKRESKYTGNYYDWSDYGILLRKKLKNIRLMVDDYRRSSESNSAGEIDILKGPLTILSKNKNKEEEEEEEVDMMAELLYLEVIEREDRFVLSNEYYRNKIMALYSTVLFNWYVHGSGHAHFIADGSSSKNVDGHSKNDESRPSSSSSSSSSLATTMQWTAHEMSYLRTFALLSGNEFHAYNFNGKWVGNRMSGYSYSHTLDTSNKNTIVSNRLRIGTTINFKELWNAAKSILKERNIELEEDIMNDLNAHDGHGKMYSFHGLGWDGGTDGSGSSQTFKLFIMYHNYNQLATEYQTLAGKGGAQIARFCLEHGLLSFAYDKNNEKSETRLVMYPKEVEDARTAGLDVPSFTGTTALMFTDSGRAMVPLYDIERGRMCAWYSQFPSNAQHIIDKWNHVGGSLETVSYQTATKFSIYFPSVSN